MEKEARMYQQKKKTTMRDRAADEESRPTFVRGNNATPVQVGAADDIAWAMAEEIEKFFYKEGINTGRNTVWYFKAVQASLDKSMIRKAYSDPNKHGRFRDGDGRQLTLADFGRNIVRYFRRNASWQYCSNAQDVIGMLLDPVTLDDCTKGLWRVYRDRRTKRGID
jgi:hypothetical protein